MKFSKFVIMLVTLSLVTATFAPAALASPPQAQPQSTGLGLPRAAGQPALLQEPDVVTVAPLLECTGNGTGGDRADMRGIQFTIDQNFSRVVVRMDASAPGMYKMIAELRRSDGYLVAPEATKLVTVKVPGNPSTTPYVPVGINFGPISVAGSETFTIRFTAITGPGTLYFETYGIGNTPCKYVMETDENNVANPTERGDPAGFKVLPSTASLSIASNYVATPPSIDGVVGFGEWQIVNQIPINNGFITVLNDSIRLYILVDLLSDTGDDTGRDPDYFWLTFDANQDVAINSNLDLNYGIEPSTGNMRYQYYLGAATWTGLQPNTLSSKGRGFGCFFSDGSFTLTSIFPLNFSCSQHRVWEFGIDLAEIMTAAGGSARMGLRVSSPNPSFTEDTPGSFYTDFSDLIEISLGAPRAPVVADPAASISLETDAMELTQAIQDRQNTLALVQDKRTVGRVYVDVNGVATPQPVVTYLYGSRDGIDLPGSPLATLHMAPTAINRNSISHTANFLLPNTWDEGTVNFSSRAADLFGNLASSGNLALNFTPKEVPVYWIVPINTGTSGSPVLVSNAEISSQESYLETVYPVKDVNFIRKSWDVIGPTTVNDAIDELNQYHSIVVLAWILSVIFTGNEPYALPDQIYGFTPSGGGLSDPVWFSGNGYVGRGFRGTSREGTMAHEINHNLDRDTTGTWGRHVPFGCGAGGPDSAWPYPNDDIQETGFDTRLPWVNGSGGQDTVIPGTTPDFMSYCQSGRLPTKWISPYRWTNLFNNFATVTMNARMLARAAEIQPVYYISGHVDVGGPGGLDPILAQPGIPSGEVAPGEYAIEVLDAQGKVLYSKPFMAVFIDPEGDPIDTVYFNHQIPAQEGAAKVILKHNNDILDEIIVSAHAPTVTVLEPNGGEQWSGVQTIRWSASDSDGDPLSFSVLYSPDDGATWLPVANQVTGDSLEVNTANLAGSQNARVRVIASDGFNNGEDDSDGTFSVAENAPVVHIDSPAPTEDVQPGTQVHLAGNATDAEDGELPEEAFVWTSGDNVLGTGREVDAILPGGQNEVTLSVTDSDGNVSQASTQVLVGARIYLPVLTR